MRLTNDSYVIELSSKGFTERYLRDADGWFKVSARGRTFRMTAEQVLNHLLPALAGLKPGLSVEVTHHERREVRDTTAPPGPRAPAPTGASRRGRVLAPASPRARR